MVLSDLELWPVATVERGDVPVEAADDLRTIAAWSRDYLLEEHPALGRSGPVCPYTRTAIERDLYLLAAPVLDGSADAIRAVVPAFRDAYLARAERVEPRLRGFLTIVIVLAQYKTMPSEELDAVQASLKGEFVRRGLMLGQFHPDCELGGIWNPEFRALRSPIPLLAIRTMVRFDRPFLMDDPAYVAEYEARFG
jgi:hypothetical protein